MKLLINQIALESVGFTHRDDYLSIPANTPVAQTQVNLTTQCQRAEGDSGAIVKLTAKSEEGGLYRFNVTFFIAYTLDWSDGNAVPDDLDKRLMVTGSTMLFPYVREVVSSLSGRGRFGPSWLAPTNFNNIEAVRVSPPETASVTEP